MDGDLIVRYEDPVEINLTTKPLPAASRVPHVVGVRSGRDPAWTLGLPAF
jgi:hypothetical protein